MNRKIDDMGRIVIPKEMRKKLGLNNGEEVNIELAGDKVVISNPNSFDLKKYIEEEINELREIHQERDFTREEGTKLNTLRDILNKIK